MFSLRGLFDATRKAARQRARENVQRRHPGYVVGSVRLRADEEKRHVFAVFYRDRDCPTIPGPYILLAVPKDGGEVEELERTVESPYWIRGLK